MTEVKPARQNQHYLPQVLLRNFAGDGELNRGDTVWVFDKRDSRVFRTNVRNIAAECEFYELSNDRGLSGVESLLSDLESHAALALQRILATRLLSSLNSVERRWFSIFCAVQFTRGPNAREKQKSISDALRRKLAVFQSDQGQTAPDHLNPETDDLKELAIRLLLRGAKRIFPLL